MTVIKRDKCGSDLKRPHLGRGRKHSPKGLGTWAIETACLTARLQAPNSTSWWVHWLIGTWRQPDKSYHIYARRLQAGCKLILAGYKPEPVGQATSIPQRPWPALRHRPGPVIGLPAQRDVVPPPFSLLQPLHTSSLSLDSHTPFWMLLTSQDPSLGSTAHTAPPDPHSHSSCGSPPMIPTRICHSTLLCALSLPLSWALPVQDLRSSDCCLRGDRKAVDEGLDLVLPEPEPPQFNSCQSPIFMTAASAISLLWWPLLWFNHRIFLLNRPHEHRGFLELWPLLHSLTCSAQGFKCFLHTDGSLTSLLSSNPLILL